jgi:hypothetical protein
MAGGGGGKRKKGGGDDDGVNAAARPTASRMANTIIAVVVLLLAVLFFMPPQQQMAGFASRGALAIGVAGHEGWLDAVRGAWAKLACLRLPPAASVKAEAKKSLETGKEAMEHTA